MESDGRVVDRRWHPEAISRNEISAERARNRLNRMVVIILAVGLSVIVAFAGLLHVEVARVERNQAAIERTITAQSELERDRAAADLKRTDDLNKFAVASFRLIETHDRTVRRDLNRALALIAQELNAPENKEGNRPAVIVRRIAPGSPGFIGPVAPSQPRPCQPLGKSGKCQK